MSTEDGMADLDRMYGYEAPHPEPVDVRIFRANAHAKLPAYATAGSVGLDLQAMERVHLTPGERFRVGTGIRIALPVGYEAQVRPRSSVAAKGLLVNHGTVDSDYLGEIMLAGTFVGLHYFTAEAGERLAQLVIAPVPRIRWQEVATADELGATERGASGFGSTGK